MNWNPDAPVDVAQKECGEDITATDCFYNCSPSALLKRKEREFI
jgi:hypothetical protein